MHVLKRIAVILLGGTITMVPSDSGGIVPSLDAEALLTSVPQLREIARIEALSMLGLPGSALELSHLVKLARVIRSKLEAGADGVVVIQGTDTIEDTAFVLDLLLKGDQPVVVTGAMRGPQSLSTDGPANLLAAVRVAASKINATGVLVVLNDEIHSARFVNKAHTSSLNAFQSPGSGIIGHVVEERIHLSLMPARSPTIRVPDGAMLCDVALVPLGLGEDGRMLTTLKVLGYKGAVVEGMGAGHVPAACLQRVADLTLQMPVVLTTRVRAGRVHESTYGFPGGEIDLIARGLLPSGQLGSSKARLLLTLLLSSGLTSSDLDTAFSSHVE